MQLLQCQNLSSILLEDAIDVFGAAVDADNTEMSTLWSQNAPADILRTESVNFYLNSGHTLSPSNVESIPYSKDDAMLVPSTFSTQKAPCNTSELSQHSTEKAASQENTAQNQEEHCKTHGGIVHTSGVAGESVIQISSDEEEGNDKLVLPDGYIKGVNVQVSIIPFRIVVLAITRVQCLTIFPICHI